MNNLIDFHQFLNESDSDLPLPHTIELKKSMGDPYVDTPAESWTADDTLALIDFFNESIGDGFRPAGDLRSKSHKGRWTNYDTAKLVEAVRWLYDNRVTVKYRGKYAASFAEVEKALA